MQPRACLALAATLTVVLAASGSALGSDTIASSGPLTSIQTTADLNCDVDHAGDDHGEFFGETACGTLVAVDGTLFGPATIPAGSSASPRFPWEPVSQLSSGSGSPTDPYRIVTVVHGGGISLTQTDTYVVGSESYGTRVAISNTTGRSPTRMATAFPTRGSRRTAASTRTVTARPT